MKLFRVIQLVAAVALLQLGQTAESASCDSELIDGDKYRVSDQLFFTDRETSEPAHQVRQGSGKSWCTEEPLSIHDSPWIEVRFGVDVEIRALSTAGWDGILTDEYVRSYQVQYARLGQQQLQYVTDQGSNSAKTFGRQDNPDLQRVELPAPIVVERIRIIVVPGSWTGDRACMRVEAHGCPVHTTCSSSIRLSDDRILLPLASIVASSQNGDDPASDLVDTGTNAWCSVEPVNSGPHIVLTFTQPVVLTHMTGRGGVAGLSYVTEFSIQSQIGGVFEQYQQPNGTIEFIAPDEKTTVFTFWRPLHANTSIRFNVLEATYNFINLITSDFCFNVQLFGCLLSQANVSSSSLSSTSVMPPLVTSPSHTITINGQSLSSMILTSSPLSITSSPMASSPLQMTSSSSIMALMTSSSVPMASHRVPMASSPPVNRLSSGQTVGVSVGVVLAVLMVILLIMAGTVIWTLLARKKRLASNDVYMTVGNDMLYSSELRYDDKTAEKEINSAVQMTSCHDNLYEVVGDREDKLELVEHSESMVDNPMYGGGSATPAQSKEPDSHKSASEEDMAANPLYAGSSEHLAACSNEEEPCTADMSTATGNPMYASCSSADMADNRVAENPMYGQTDQK